MIKLAVTGCQGRMGQRIVHLAGCDEAFELNVVFEHGQHPQLTEKVEGLAISTDLADLSKAQVLIDFTLPQATLPNIKACVAHGVGMVIGTTGLSDEHFMAVDEAAKKIPIVISGNMSLGVNILFKLTQLLSQVTPATYTAKIEEGHHIHKKDKPSGTARMLEQFVDEAATQRQRFETHSIREGEIIGDHTVTFESDEDIITIAHHAKNRDIFAKGALVAAKFVAQQTAGRFDMQDVLGLR